MISHISRKNREDIVIKQKGGMNDLFDNEIKMIYRIDDEQYDYLCEKMTEDEIDLFIGDSISFTEKRKLLSLLSLHLTNYYNEKP